MFISVTDKVTSFTKVAAAMVAMLLLAVVMAVVPSVSAQAASFGSGFGYGGAYGPSSPPTGWLGSYVQPGGLHSYCIEPGKWGPTNAASDDAGIVTAFTSTGPSGANPRAIPAADLARINMVVSKYGQTNSDVQAAAVALTVFHLANPAAFAAHIAPYTEAGYYNSGSGKYTNDTNWAQLQALKTQFLNEAAAFTVGSGSGSATMTFEVDAANNYDGTLTIATLTPSPSTASIILTNGVFDVTGTDTFVGPVSQGQTLDVIGVPPVPGDPYKIAADATFTASQYGPKIHLWQNPGRQSTATPGGNTNYNFTSHADDPFDRTVGFQPVVTSQVAQRYIASGSPLVDNLVFSVQPDAAGVVNQWPTQVSGDYARVVTNGTVYGPFATPQTQSSTVPVGAPVAGTATVTTSYADGPTVTYAATSDNNATAAGYYVWVWEIDYDDQSALTKVYLPAPDAGAGLSGYYWADDFGLNAETAIVTPDVSTVATPTGIAGYAISDTATVTGTVFADAELGFEAFLQVDASATCTPATLAFTSSRQPVASAGEYTSDEFTPMVGGTYFWVETLYDGAGDVAYQGVCGMPLETSVVTQFVLTTKATANVTPGTEIRDTAIISGVLPEDAVLTFNGYFSETSTPVCDAGNLAFSTDGTPITVAAGFYDEATFDGELFSTKDLGEGYVFWVESLTDTTGTVLASGVCGAEGETTTLKLLAYTGAGDTSWPATFGGLVLLFGLVLAAFSAAIRNERARQM